MLCHGDVTWMSFIRKLCRTLGLHRTGGGRNASCVLANAARGRTAAPPWRANVPRKGNCPAVFQQRLAPRHHP